MFKDFSQFNSSRFIYQQPKKKAPEKKERAAAKPDPSPKTRLDQRARGQQAIDRRLRGFSISDKAKAYADRVFEMLVTNPPRPGSTLQERIDYYTTLLPVSRLRFSGQERAEIAAYIREMEDAYEDSWVREAQKDAKWGLSYETHFECLRQLRNIPFHQVMEWYETSDGGFPRPGQKDVLPRQIDTGPIHRLLRLTKPTPNSEQATRHALWQTVDRFLLKAGGREALKRRWISMLNDPNIKPKNEAERKHVEWIRSAKPKQADITWHTVLMAETDPAELYASFASEISLKEITSRDAE